MNQVNPQAKLTRSLAVLWDALYVATKRCGDAASAAEDVDTGLAELLGEIHHKLANSCLVLDETLAELQNPPTGFSGPENSVPDQ